MQRVIAIALAVFFLGLAGLMASVTLFVRDPLPVLTARAPLTVHTGETPDAGLRATLAVDPAFRFEVTGQGTEGDALPRVTLRRGEGGGASDIDVPVQAAAQGLFQGRGSFTAPGRWVLVLDDGGARGEFPFILQE